MDYLQSEGYLNILEGFTAEKAQEEHIVIERALKKFIKTYTSAEKIRFFNNPESKKLMGAILENLYTAEFKIRNIAFDGVPTSTEDETMKEMASLISIKSAISKSHAI